VATKEVGASGKPNVVAETGPEFGLVPRAFVAETVML
jgi:hypothetical protein